MAPVNSEDKKGGTRTRRKKKPFYCTYNSELEMQILEKVERAQEGSSTRDGGQHRYM